MTQPIRFEVRDEWVGLRLDRALGLHYTELSRSIIQKAIDSGKVLVNGRVAKPGWKLSREDQISGVLEQAHKESAIVGEAIPLDVLYEDDVVAVLNKRAGMVVHPGAGVHTGTLAHALVHRYGNALPALGGADRPGIVHRLDKETTGLILVALTEKAHRQLSKQFAERTIKKEYRALVWGKVEENFVADFAIKRSPVDPLRMAVMQTGRASLTRFEVVRQVGWGSELLSRPETGRTHQIRVHLAHVGHPLLGDALYGGGRELWMKRMDPLVRGQVARCCNEVHRVMLHAETLSFLHPGTKKRVTYTAPLPTDFEKARACLK